MWKQLLQSPSLTPRPVAPSHRGAGTSQEFGHFLRVCSALAFTPLLGELSVVKSQDHRDVEKAAHVMSSGMWSLRRAPLAPGA